MGGTSGPIDRLPSGFDGAAAALALEQLRCGHPVQIVARGRSMWPFLLDGDVLTLTPDGRARLGDIVLVPLGEFGVVHRVVLRAPGWVCPKGDALPAFDGWVRTGAPLARVTEVRRGAASFVPLRCLPLPVSVAAWLWPR